MARELHVGDVMQCKGSCVHAVSSVISKTEKVADPGTTEREYGHAVANGILQLEVTVVPRL